MTATFKPGDRVSFRGDIGTIIRVGGTYGNIAIVASDNSPSDDFHRKVDQLTAAELGIEGKVIHYAYFDDAMLKPIIDAKSPSGTKVRIKNDGHEFNATIVRHDPGTYPYNTDLICHVPGNTKTGNIYGGVGLGMIENVKAARVLGMNVNTDRFVYPKAWEDITYVASPDEIRLDAQEKASPKPPSYAGLSPGDIVRLKVKTWHSNNVIVDGIVIQTTPSYVNPITVIALNDLTNGPGIMSPTSVEVEAAKQFGVSLVRDNCWVCDKSDTEVIEVLGNRGPQPVDKQETTKTIDSPKPKVSLVPAMMIIGTAIGGLLGLLTNDGTSTRVATDEAIIDDQLEATEESGEAQL